MNKIITLLTFFLCTICVSAYDFEKDGIYYNITSVENMTVSVTNSGTFIGPSGIPSGKEYFGDIVIPDYVFFSGRQFSVNEISEYAFFESEITSITFPNTLKRISRSAFEGCSNLGKITIPESVIQIWDFAFGNCSSLKEAIIADSETPLGISVINMSGGIFRMCPLDYLYIGRNIRRIVSYDDDGSFTNDPGGSPFGFYQIKSDSLKVSLGNSVTTLSESLFRGAKFYNFDIPNSVNNIERLVFFECRNLESIIIPNNVTVIKTETFRECNNLKTIDLGDNVLAIERIAFTNCTNLNKIKLSKNLKTIEDEAFVNCQSLEEIVFPQSLTNIGELAFEGCNKIKKIQSNAYYPPKAYDNSFSSVAYWLTVLSIPYGTKSQYNVVDGWKNFNNIEEDVNNIAKYRIDYYVDGNIYKSYEVEYGTKLTPEPFPIKEGYTFSGWSEIPEVMPDHDVIVTGSFSMNEYKLTYIVDGQIYKATEVNYGAVITPEPAPVREGYTFSGWSEIPKTMPAHDVTITGSFTVNKYQLTYIVDGEEYKTYEVEYGAAITPEPEPTKEGFVFSGWNGLPETMPAHVVIVTGTFSKAKYMLTYMVDGEVYKSQEMDYGATITPEPVPTKEGHTFSGWSEIPATMPAHDVTVTGSFSVNKYILTYILDGKEYKTMEVEYGAVITPEPDPEKEGYTFSGWIGLPEIMPAKLVIVTGTFSINSYTLTYMIDEEVYKQVVYEYGAAITPEPQPEGDYVSFEWVGLPETMPAHDVTVTAVYETGIAEIMMMAKKGQLRIYSPNGKKLDKLQKGLNIVVMQDGTTKKVVVK